MATFVGANASRTSGSLKILFKIVHIRFLSNFFLDRIYKIVLAWRTGETGGKLGLPHPALSRLRRSLRSGDTQIPPNLLYLLLNRRYNQNVHDIYNNPDVQDKPRNHSRKYIAH